MRTHPTRRYLSAAASCALVVAATVASAPAQEAGTAAPAEEDLVVLDTRGVITPEAQAVLDRMTATLNGMKRFEVTARVTHDEVLPFGYKLQNNETARLWVEKPDRLRVEVAGDIKNRTYVYDGAKVTMFAPDLDVYSSTKAPGTIGELVTALLDAGVEMPLIDMLYHGNAGSLTEDARVGLVVGETEIDGVATDHLAFRQPNVDWQLWVQKGAQALPRKLLITTRYEVGEPQYQAVMDWNPNPDIDAKSFTFTPPETATEIQNRTQLVASGGNP